MSLSAADLPAPIAVLVLAWGEASPAVRALVEATQVSAPTVNSILVMVPQADAPDHLSAEEYLPLPPPAEYAAPPAAAQQLPTLAGPATPPLAPAEAAPASAIIPGTAALAAEPVPAQATPAPGLPLAAAAPAPLAWAAVRILRLGSYSMAQLAHRAGQPLPAPVWAAAAQLPAAPYLGATPLAPAAGPASEATDAQAPANASEPTRAIAPGTTQVSPVSPIASAPPAASERTAAAPAYVPAEELLQGPLEIELPLVEAEEEVDSEELPSDGLFQETDFLSTPAQAGWPEALAALRQPAALAAPTSTGAVPSAPPLPGSHAVVTPPSALRPAATHYPAPDLNFQIIQYARFAVPVALAEAEFAVIYAPAWPTWLAAQELRQRTGRPLVLHVASLAAGTEPVSTATGWIAELQRQALQRADLILTETPALAERLRRELGRPFASVQAVAAADALAIAQALHAAQARPTAGQP